jgi:aspartate aminotransferase
MSSEAQSDAQFLSRRILNLQPSATLAMDAKAKKLAAEGKNVISLSVGQPDFKTAKHICDAAKKAIDDGMHGYTAVGGVPELKQAIAAQLTRDTGVAYAANQVVASPGGKYSLYLTFQTLLNEGDEIIIPSPFWVSYPEMARLAGATPVLVPTKEEERFALTPEALEATITPKTKVLLINSPSNPTGQIIPPEYIEAIGKIVEKHGLWCVSDEIYNHLIFGDAKHKSIASVSDYCRDHTVVVNGASKTFAMTGWRIGWIGAPVRVAKAIEDMQSQTCSNPCSIAQAATVAALNGPMDYVNEMKAEFAARRELIHELLNALPGVKCSMPQGAFYAFPNISGLYGRTIGGVRITCPTDFCNIALEKALVAMVPGEAFGGPDNLRISYAVSQASLREACKRLKELIEGE